jgi:RNA polymerase sporulation-specific sigma factor
MQNNPRPIGFYLQDYEKPNKIENEALFEQLNHVDNEEAQLILDRLLSDNLKLVAYIMHRRYTNVTIYCERHKISYDDLFSTGTFGLWKAILTFRPEKEYKFATYATTIIHNELGMFHRSINRHDTIPLETIIATDKDNHELTLIDIIADDGYSVDDLVKDNFNTLFLESFVKTLKDKDKLILRMYFFEDINQKEIGKLLGMSQSYVSRLTKRIVAKGKKHYNKILKED